MPDEQKKLKIQPEQQSNKLAICVNKRFSDKPSCGMRGSIEIANAMESGITERKLDIQVERIICFGMCTQGPSMRLIPGGDFFRQVKIEDVSNILDQLERIIVSQE
ncbi:MAG: (2Fe-2S) ferredoxin domain-containing protein [Rhodospirillales bacterium]|nr:(2Fe-2S) ferredoxin domain-containing protein [Rhodospirillales bacterium]